jgi:hypothetical protein
MLRFCERAPFPPTCVRSGSDRHPQSRFLRARKFDLAKAKVMFIDCEKWRKDFKVDELYETFDYKVCTLGFHLVHSVGPV